MRERFDIAKLQHARRAFERVRVAKDIFQNAAIRGVAFEAQQTLVEVL